MDFEEAKIRHLEMVQEVVKRMASNLFYLKGWAITLIAGAFALAAKDSNDIYLFLPYFPLIIFWALDGYFLSQERLFRRLYDEVRLKTAQNVDFSMDTRPYQKGLVGKFLSLDWAEGLTRPTILAFYVPLLLVIVSFTVLILNT